jgi:hypothetical protein
VITAGLVELGLLQGDVDELIASEAYKRFYMHRAGHWLGMDVHDVGEYKVGGEWRVLEVGMALTVEPGIYIAPDNQNVAKKWRGIGVRIEDDVVVTKQGCEILTGGVPKTVAEIEALMAAARGMSRVNLAIIGGGLVGASLALALQAGAKARGWKILLIEPFAPGDSFQPSYDARSSALSFGTRQIYQRLGVWQEISRRAEPIKQIHVSDRGRFLHRACRRWKRACRRWVTWWKTPGSASACGKAWTRRGQLALPGGSHAHGAAAGWLSPDPQRRNRAGVRPGGAGRRRPFRPARAAGHRRETPYNQSALIANITPSEAHNGRPSSASPTKGRWPCCRCRTTAARWSGPARAWTPSAWPTRRAQLQ